MPQQPPPCPAAGSRPAALNQLADASARLLTSQHHLARQLHAAGLIIDRVAATLLALEDQLDAAITELRTHLSA
jgi:hypothetical protein